MVDFTVDQLFILVEESSMCDMLSCQVLSTTLIVISVKQCHTVQLNKHNSSSGVVSYVKTVHTANASPQLFYALLPVGKILVVRLALYVLFRTFES